MRDLDVGRLIALSSAVALIIGTSYTLDYSFVLGDNLFVYFELNDHIRITIEWIPIIIVVGVFLWMHIGVDRSWQIPTRKLWSVPVAVLFFGTVFGAIAGARDKYSRDSGTYNVMSLIKNGKQDIEAQILFLLDKTVILRDKHGSLMVIPRDEVSIRRVKVAQDSKE